VAAIVWADVTAHASDLSTVSAGAQTDVLAYVNDTVDPDKLGGEASARYRLARIYLAAHFGTVVLAQGTPPAGPVTSESVGGVSRTYGVAAGASGSASEIASTGWGREYLALIRRSAASRGPLVL
jgi:hypothetical protein